MRLTRFTTRAQTHPSVATTARSWRGTLPKVIPTERTIDRGSIGVLSLGSWGEMDSVTGGKGLLDGDAGEKGKVR